MVSLAGESGTSMEEVDMEAGNPDGSFTSPSEERDSEVLRLKYILSKKKAQEHFFS